MSATRHNGIQFFRLSVHVLFVASVLANNAGTGTEDDRHQGCYVALCCAALLLLATWYFAVLQHYTIEDDNELAKALMKKVTATITVQRRRPVLFIRGIDVSKGRITPRLVVTLRPFLVAWSSLQGGGGGGEGGGGGCQLRVQLLCSAATYARLEREMAREALEAGSAGVGDEKDRVFSITELKKNMEKRWTCYYKEQVSGLKTADYALREGSAQARVCMTTLDLYRARGNAVVWVEAPPCSGKSSVAVWLCKELDGVKCDFDPTRSGEDLAVLRNDADGRPLVLLIDEADVKLRAVRRGQVELNDAMDTYAHDKTGWNVFLDKVSKMPGMIVILTSNTPKRELDEEEVRLQQQKQQQQGGGRAGRFARRCAGWVAFMATAGAVRPLPRCRGSGPLDASKDASNLRPGRVHACFRCSGIGKAPPAYAFNDT